MPEIDDSSTSWDISFDSDFDTSSAESLASSEMSVGVGMQSGGCCSVEESGNSIIFHYNHVRGESPKMEDETFDSSFASTSYSDRHTLYESPPSGIAREKVHLSATSSTPSHSGISKKAATPKSQHRQARSMVYTKSSKDKWRGAQVHTGHPPREISPFNSPLVSSFPFAKEHRDSLSAGTLSGALLRFLRGRTVTASSIRIAAFIISLLLTTVILTRDQERVREFARQTVPAMVLDSLDDDATLLAARALQDERSLVANELSTTSALQLELDSDNDDPGIQRWKQEERRIAHARMALAMKENVIAAQSLEEQNAEHVSELLAADDEQVRSQEDQEEMSRTIFQSENPEEEVEGFPLLEKVDIVEQEDAVTEDDVTTQDNKDKLRRDEQDSAEVTSRDSNSRAGDEVRVTEAYVGQKAPSRLKNRLTFNDEDGASEDRVSGDQGGQRQARPLRVENARKLAQSQFEKLQAERAGILPPDAPSLQHETVALDEEYQAKSEHNDVNEVYVQSLLKEDNQDQPTLKADEGKEEAEYRQASNMDNNGGIAFEEANPRNHLNENAAAIANSRWAEPNTPELSDSPADVVRKAGLAGEAEAVEESQAISLYDEPEKPQIQMQRLRNALGYRRLGSNQAIVDGDLP